LFNFLLDFITPAVAKYLVPILGTVCVIAGIAVWYLHSENTKLNEEAGAMRIQITTLVQVHEEERQKAKTAIETQNQAIDQYRIDLDNYNKVVVQKNKEIETAYRQKQMDITKELVRDSSSDRQLEIVSNLLKDFSQRK
jgi:hypothetical protein